MGSGWRMDLVPPRTQAVEPESPEFAGSEEFYGPRIGACVIDLALLLGLFAILALTSGEASVGGPILPTAPYPRASPKYPIGVRRLRPEGISNTDACSQAGESPHTKGWWR